MQREFLQRQKVVEEKLKLIRYQEKKIKLQYLAGIQTIWKWLESLNGERMKHHLAVGD